MTMSEEEKKELVQFVLDKKEEGKIVVMTFEGLMSAPLEDFIKQPADGLLYDLNRDTATTLSFVDDPKWVNDFAVALVIRKLKAENERLSGLKTVLKRIDAKAISIVAKLSYRTSAFQDALTIHQLCYKALGGES